MKKYILALTLLAMSIISNAGDAQIIPITQESRIVSPNTLNNEFNISEVNTKQQVRLAMDARVDWVSLGGSHTWMIVDINGNKLVLDDLINKPREFTMRDGSDATWAYGITWRVLYSPDFSNAVKTVNFAYGITDTDPYHFVWDITRFIKSGKNTVSITQTQQMVDPITLVVRGVHVEIGDPVKSANNGNIAPPPTGKVPTYIANVPIKQPKINLKLGDSGSISFVIGNKTFNLKSRTSNPDGKWLETSANKWTVVSNRKAQTAKWTGDGYTVTRKVSVKNNRIDVADTIANTTDKIIGVIYENRLDLSNSEKAKILLCGRSTFAGADTRQDPGHPSCIAEMDDFAIGLFAVDDIFRVHSVSFVEKDAMGIADRQLGIGPGKSHTMEWSIYPSPKGSYWSIINNVRKDWGSNITIPGPTWFDQPMITTKSQEDINDYVKSRGLKLVFSSQTSFKDGMLAEGTAIVMAKEWCENAVKWQNQLRTADPGIKTVVYLHPSICTEPNAQTLYADCKILDASGNHVTSPYTYPVYEYLSTKDNAYGKALFKTVEDIFSVINPDGIFMDEIAYGSVPPYAYNAQWDGCTVDINPETHKVIGQRSSVLLLEQSWKTDFVNYLRKHGKILIGNGSSYTRTMLSWKVPIFCELASYSNLIGSHLSTPWALGNHEHGNTEQIRTRMVRRSLDFGGLLTIYAAWEDNPPGKHYMPLMYPTTPEEIRPGVVLGKERIVTNKSGQFGWLDNSNADVYVFDSDGKLVKNSLVKKVVSGKFKLTEVRLSGDQFAILVKKK